MRTVHVQYKHEGGRSSQLTMRPAVVFFTPHVYTVHGNSALSARFPEDGRLNYISKTKMTPWCLLLATGSGSDGGAERAAIVSDGQQMLRYSPPTPPRSHCRVPRYMVCPSVGQHAVYITCGEGGTGGARQSR